MLAFLTTGKLSAVIPDFVLLHVAGLRVQIGQSIRGSSIA